MAMHLHKAAPAPQSPHIQAEFPVLSWGPALPPASASLTYSFFTLAPCLGILELTSIPSLPHSHHPVPPVGPFLPLSYSGLLSGPLLHRDSARKPLSGFTDFSSLPSTYFPKCFSVAIPSPLLVSLQGLWQRPRTHRPTEGRQVTRWMEAG